MLWFFAILVSAALIKGGDNGTDEFIARQAWLYVSILGAGYFISRGWPSPAAASPTPTIKAIAAPVTIATDPLTASPLRQQRRRRTPVR